MELGQAIVVSVAAPLALWGARDMVEWFFDKIRTPSVQGLRPLLSEALENEAIAAGLKKAGAIAAEAHAKAQEDGWSDQEQEEFLLACFDLVAIAGRRLVYRILRSRSLAK